MADPAAGLPQAQPACRGITDMHRSSSASYCISADDLVQASAATPGWTRTQIPADLGVGYADHRLLEDGLSVVMSNHVPNRHLQEDSVVDRPTEALTITVALQGRSCYRGRDGGRLDFLAGHTTVSRVRQAAGERRYLAHETVRQLRLIVAAPVLSRYGLHALLQVATDGHACRQIFHGRSSNAVTQSARALARLHADGGTPLDLQIAALSLLSEQARQITPAPTSTAWRGRDLEQLHQARDILQRHYDRPLTVAYLCAAVGTNEFKLKEGFRAVFGTTPHRLLTDIRMRAARELLETGHPVTRVAQRVGFQHASSFSAAFQRHYGRSPKSVCGHPANS